MADDGADLQMAEAASTPAAHVLFVETETTPEATTVRPVPARLAAIHAVHADVAPRQTAPTGARVCLPTEVPTTGPPPLAEPATAAIQAMVLPACVTRTVLDAATASRQERLGITVLLSVVGPPPAAVATPTTPLALQLSRASLATLANGYHAREML